MGERRWKTAYDEEVQPGKTLWDWLQLLIVPAILIGVTFAWSATQTRSDNRREDRRIAADRAAAKEARQDTTLQNYLDQMSGLMLNKNLLTSADGDPVRAVARTVTLTTLRRLDLERRAAVVRFLSEARLLRGESPPVVMKDANLRDVDFSGADLRLANLDDVDLGGANLSDTNLSGASFVTADLRGADLSDAYFSNTQLGYAVLRGADLRGADLRLANVRYADLRDADLRETQSSKAPTSS